MMIILYNRILLYNWLLQYFQNNYNIIISLPSFDIQLNLQITTLYIYKNNITYKQNKKMYIIKIYTMSKGLFI